jgi:hypothetical protein
VPTFNTNLLQPRCTQLLSGLITHYSNAIHYKDSLFEFMIELVTNKYVQFSFQDITFEIRDWDSNDGIFKKVFNVLSNVVF